MKCFYCRQDSEWVETRKSFIVELDSRIIIIKNTPCKECKCCGEALFSNDETEKLDELFDIAKRTMYDYVEMDYDDPSHKVYRLVKELVSEENKMRVAENLHNYGK